MKTRIYAAPAVKGLNKEYMCASNWDTIKTSANPYPADYCRF